MIQKLLEKLLEAKRRMEQYRMQYVKASRRERRELENFDRWLKLRQL